MQIAVPVLNETGDIYPLSPIFLTFIILSQASTDREDVVHDNRIDSFLYLAL